jgi:hypothetical protein
MAFDSLNNCTVLFGGYDGTNVFGDTFEYDNKVNTWVDRNPEKAPYPRSAHAMVYDSSQLCIILFGGVNFGDTWLYRYEFMKDGFFISPVIDALKIDTYWYNIDWIAQTPMSTSIKVQIASNDDRVSWYFVGPAGDENSFYEYPSTISDIHQHNRYLRCKVYFETTHPGRTPVLETLRIVYNRVPEKPVLIEPMTYVNTSTPLFRWQFDDMDMDTQKAFRIFVDDSSEFDSINYDSGVQYSANPYWRFKEELADGIWYWRCRVLDSEDSWSEYSGTSMNIDTKAPVIKIINPSLNATLYYGHEYDLEWVAQDRNLGRRPVGIYYCSEPTKWHLIADNLPIDGTYSWQVPEIEYNKILLKFVCTDRAGNTAEKIIWVKLQYPPPPTIADILIAYLPIIVFVSALITAITLFKTYKVMKARHKKRIRKLRRSVALKSTKCRSCGEKIVGGVSLVIKCTCNYIYHPWCANKLKICLNCKSGIEEMRETVIDEVFLIYHDGRLIKHFTRRLRPDIDQRILSSMLVAVQDFVKDSFKGVTGGLDELKYGDLKILIGRGKWLIIAAVVAGEDVEKFRPQVGKALAEMEWRYAPLLKDWDGEIGKLIVLERYVYDLIAGKYR